MYVTLLHDTNACHTMAWYQCMSHYGMVPMHVILWHGINACHMYNLHNVTVNTMA